MPHKTVNTGTIILGYFLTIFVLPLFVQIFITAAEIIEFKKITRILNSDPFSQLTSAGFAKTFTSEKSKYLPSMPMLSGTIDNYPVHIEFEKGIVRVIAEADLDLVEKWHMIELKTMFGKNNIEYDIGVALLYRPSRRKNLIWQDLNSELHQFISFLNRNKISPWVEDGKI
jgi:hypothetical protein